MKDNKFKIEKIEDIKFVDSNGNKLVDLRDKEPIEYKFNPDTPIIDLVKSVSPSYDICNHPLIRKYGYDTFGSICEAWYWTDELNSASELELWQIYAIIQADSNYRYQYCYDKEVCDFRKYRREHGDDPNVWKF